MKKILECQDPELPEGSRRFLFMCPGCKYGHCVITPRWQWNGRFDEPTFSPSVLTGHNPPDFNENRCHSFITDGNIQFLSDCWHELKGQTVALPDLDEEAS